MLVKLSNRGFGLMMDPMKKGVESMDGKIGEVLQTVTLTYNEIKLIRKIAKLRIDDVKSLIVERGANGYREREVEELEKLLEKMRVPVVDEVLFKIETFQKALVEAGNDYAESGKTWSSDNLYLWSHRISIIRDKIDSLNEELKELRG